VEVSRSDGERRVTSLRPRTNWVAPPGPVADGLVIGLLGGSFNPAHEGHLHASVLALNALGLDYVWWLVSPQNPLKPQRGMAAFDRRLNSARAIARNPRIVVTGIEAALGTRYTVDTLHALARRFPRVRFVWLMGSDNLVQLPRWREWQAIFGLLPVAVIARPGTATASRSAKAAQRFRGDYRAPCLGFGRLPPPVWTMLDGKRSRASATAIRRRMLSRE
jgi:nicotinate-nucleotide adenylyltransferase